MLTAFVAILDVAQPITSSGNFDASGTSPASPAQSASRTLTVPAGNPGDIRFAIPTNTGSPTLSYSGTKSGTPTDGGIVTGYANGNTLQITRSPAVGTTTIHVYDNVTGILIASGTLTVT